MPGFPSYFWSEDVFRHIRDRLGYFFIANKSHEVTGRMTIYGILVNIDTREGLYLEIKLSHRGIRSCENAGL